MRNNNRQRARQGVFPTILIIIVMFSASVFGQKVQNVQVKSFDQQLKPLSGMTMFINGRITVQTDAKGIAFTDIPDTELPPKHIKIQNEELEAESWNYSKGILEVIIRTKKYRIVELALRTASDKPISHAQVTYSGSKVLKAVSDATGKVEFPLGLQENITGKELVIDGHRVIAVKSAGSLWMVTAEPIAREEVAPQQARTTREEYFKDFDLKYLDSIKSLTVFYAVFKNLQISGYSPEQRRRIDAKFNSLMDNLKDSLGRREKAAPRITDSTLIRNDIQSLLAKAEYEKELLDDFRSEFDRITRIISDKVGKGIETLDAENKQQLLEDIIRLEEVLELNENKFYRNQNEYRVILSSLKAAFFDIRNLEEKLNQSEALRLQEQQEFRKKLFAALGISLAFAIFIVALSYLRARLKRQQKELVKANEEIRHINENLEHLVDDRTQLLKNAHNEIDTFLYRASHDLRSPICSIMGLCNLALRAKPEEQAILFEKTYAIARDMDKLLKKLRIISEINKPSNYSLINLKNEIEKIREDFHNGHELIGIELEVLCEGDISFYSYPYLIESILFNLISNAIFYSRLKSYQQPRVVVEAWKENENVVISILDNGVGIDDAVKDKLWNMFFIGNEHSKGNGLGLYIVNKSIQVLNGTILLETVKNEFTRFTIRIPGTSQPVFSDAALVQISMPVAGLSESPVR